ncbi:GAF domain-containing sensor histidine kinase [Neolewinella litorea]|uniref:GAF domain-containing sensor histidine kinase n=1 Tax=Neolewinella litorea TaxID=2562452 RepID=UPI001455E486|nr:ATP-binding protein [Neolewinella litorea]
MAASAQSEQRCGRKPRQLLQLRLEDLLPVYVVEQIVAVPADDQQTAVYLSAPSGWPAGDYQAVVYPLAEEIVLEIEPRRKWSHVGDYAARLDGFTRELEAETTTSGLLQRLCNGLTQHFGYDRAIVLHFDNLLNSIVTHESRVDELESMLNMRFVAADIPEDTRVRQLSETVLNFTAEKEPLHPMVGEVNPAAHEILHLKLAAREPFVNSLRFLRDTGLSTMGCLSILIDGKLWGSCFMHSIEPLYLDFQMQSFLRVVGRLVQQKIAYHLYHNHLRSEQKANEVRDRLQKEIIKAENLSNGLMAGRTTILDLLPDTHGAAICSDDDLSTAGNTPDKDQIAEIVGWVKEVIGDDKQWHTDQLAAHFPAADGYVKVAAGVLFLPLDPAVNQWIIWFKPESVRKLTYGSTAVEGDPEGRKYSVRAVTSHRWSLPWVEEEIVAARTLQNFLQKVVLQRYSLTRRHNTLLREALDDLELFSYTIGHDLRAPLRGISSYADILQDEYADRLDEEGTSFLSLIQQNAQRMRTFIDDLLALNRIDRNKMVFNSLCVTELVERVLADLSHADDRLATRCRIQKPLPAICGDHNYLIVVFTNLLSNAFKYSARADSPRVEVSFTGKYRRGFPIFCIADNGIGVPTDQQDRIFDLFTRSTNSEGFDGTGIGLALVQRIIRFHEGEVWVESEEGEGARFYFYTGVRVSSLAGAV